MNDRKQWCNIKSSMQRLYSLIVFQENEHLFYKGVLGNSQRVYCHRSNKNTDCTVYLIENHSWNIKNLYSRGNQIKYFYFSYKFSYL